MKLFSPHFTRLHIANKLCVLLLLLALTPPAEAQSRRALAGHVVPATLRLRPVAALPGTNHLNLYLGLPWRNQPELEELLRALHDPASANYHQWLTPEQFTEQFGPTVEDYQKVVGFAGQHGFKISGLYSNRMMVNVDAPVPAIEKTFRLALQQYQHPSEQRTFYAPDAEPTVDTNVPILHVAGLDNFVRPHRLGGGL